MIDDAKDAVPTAQALLSGGIDVMEITFRTAAAPDAIKAVADNCPDMLVGAGTVITLEQCQKAVEMGAKFIVSPGFDKEVVKWCVDNSVAITPGCVTPSVVLAGWAFASWRTAPISCLARWSMTALILPLRWPNPVTLTGTRCSRASIGSTLPVSLPLSAKVRWS